MTLTTDQWNRPQKMYNITKRGFIKLVFGFTGKKAEKFKDAFIDAFEEMEEQLRNRAALPNLNLSRLEIAQLLLESEQERAQLEEHNAVLEHTVDHYTPKVAAYEHVIDPKELYRLQQIGKILGVKVNKFLERLREQRYLGESRTSLGKGPFYNRPSVAMVNGGEEKIKMDVHHRYLVVT